MALMFREPFTGGTPRHCTLCGELAKWIVYFRDAKGKVNKSSKQYACGVHGATKEERDATA